MPVKHQMTASKMDTCCCLEQITKLEADVASLKQNIQERDKDQIIWRKIVQNLILEKFDFDIENEFILLGRRGQQNIEGSKTQQRTGAKDVLPTPNIVSERKTGYVDPRRRRNSVPTLTNPLKIVRINTEHPCPTNALETGIHERGVIHNSNKSAKASSSGRGNEGACGSDNLEGGSMLRLSSENIPEDNLAREGGGSIDVDTEDLDMLSQNFMDRDSMSYDNRQQPQPISIDRTTLSSDITYEHFMLTSVSVPTDEREEIEVEILNTDDFGSPISASRMSSCAVSSPNSRGPFANLLTPVSSGVSSQSLSPKENPETNSRNSRTVHSTESVLQSIEEKKSFFSFKSNMKVEATSDNKPDIMIIAEKEAEDWQKWDPFPHERKYNKAGLSLETPVKLEIETTKTATMDSNNRPLKTNKKQVARRRTSLPLSRVTEKVGEPTPTFSRYKSQSGLPHLIKSTDVSNSQYETEEYDSQEDSRVSTDLSDMSDTDSEGEDEDNDDHCSRIPVKDPELIDLLSSESSNDTHELYTNNYQDNTQSDQQSMDTTDMVLSADLSDMSQDAASVDVEPSSSNVDDSDSSRKDIEMFGTEDFMVRALRNRSFVSKLLAAGKIKWEEDAVLPQGVRVTDIKTKSAKKIVDKITGTLEFSCSVCELKTNNYERALNHAKTHFVKRSYKCVCGNTSSNDRKFFSHYKNPNFIGCFQQLASDIFDMRDFKSKSYSNKNRKRVAVDLNELKKCNKLRCKTDVKMLKCPLMDKCAMQHAALMDRLKAIGHPLPGEQVLIVEQRK